MIRWLTEIACEGGAAGHCLVIAKNRQMRMIRTMTVQASFWHNYLIPIQRIRDGAINAVAAVHAALIQTK